MKTTSYDLRRRIVESYLRGEGSIRQTAQRFKVAPSHVQKLLKLYWQTNDVKSKPRASNGPPAKLKGHETLVRQLVLENEDATLAQLCQIVEVQTGVKVAPSTLCTYLQRLGLTRKRNRSQPGKR